mmetsp:Transcript_45540/g.90241  ORF Transcript_45540/g.90241 Transcript_45540/m.90241 type:complete len:289 (+) Transcript_45540:56-922(+)
MHQGANYNQKKTRTRACFTHISQMGARPVKASANVGEKATVILQVYDVVMNPDFVACNRALLRYLGSGIFHCGVEVYGREWSYRRRLEQGTGVFSHPPRSPPGASHCESIVMGTTALSAQALWCLIEALANEWPGTDYNLLKRNCCHFCEEFCKRLGITTAFPSWVIRFAACGQALLDEGQNAAAAVSRFDRYLAGHVRQAAEALDPCSSSTDAPAFCCVAKQEDQRPVQKSPTRVIFEGGSDPLCSPPCSPPSRMRKLSAESRNSKGGKRPLRWTRAGWAYREVLEE